MYSINKKTGFLVIVHLKPKFSYFDILLSFLFSDICIFATELQK